MEHSTPLEVAHKAALRHLTALDDSRVAATVSASDIEAALGDALPFEGAAPEAVVRELCAALEPG